MLVKRKQGKDDMSDEKEYPVHPGVFVQLLLQRHSVADEEDDKTEPWISVDDSREYKFGLQVAYGVGEEVGEDGRSPKA